MKYSIVLAALLVASVVCGQAKPAGTRSAAGFQKLQSLAGEWEGKDDHGEPAKTTFAVVVSNTAVMETLAPAAMEEMITLYSRDGDAISLVHYCPTNNQPRMRAIPAPTDVKELVFKFAGAGNLASPAVGHEHKLVIQFEDENHITEAWTWRQHDRDTVQVFHFTRKNR